MKFLAAATRWQPRRHVVQQPTIRSQPAMPLSRFAFFGLEESLDKPLKFRVQETPPGEAPQQHPAPSAGGTYAVCCAGPLAWPSPFLRFACRPVRGARQSARTVGRKTSGVLSFSDAKPV